MNARPVGSAPPPFYWKVPVPEKDYMSENYRRIRQIANQGQKKRNEPLKAAFIPGVTKNDKYAHVPSRVRDFLKNKRELTEAPNGRIGPSAQNLNQRGRSSSSVGNPSQPINRRLSKSSTDLRQRQNPTAFPLRDCHTPIAPFNSNRSFNTDFIGRRRRVSEESSRHQESVYNWHFKDDVESEASRGSASFINGFNSSSIPAKYCHRVEYLPCDGICAEENFMVDDTQPESARSASSCRTSRGCNTEETRILEDPVKSFELNKSAKMDSMPSYCEGGKVKDNVLPKSRSVFTVHTGTNDNRSRNVRVGSDENRFQSNALEIKNDIDLVSRLNSMKVTDNQENGRLKTGISSASFRDVKHVNIISGGGGDMPHILGTVPKYLKQRQEEWKVQAKERKEAAMTANVPQGYVLLSDKERMDHLQTFKTNYDTLIVELNRIPIRIDTIRVREHKIQLEQQLTRLEEAMKTFSRPRVWVKVDG